MVGGGEIIGRQMRRGCGGGISWVVDPDVCKFSPAGVSDRGGAG